MSKKTTFTPDQAKAIGEQLGISWDHFDVAQFHSGLEVELEHGAIAPKTNVTHDDPLLTGKIALAHLTEFPEYSTPAWRKWRRRRNASGLQRSEIWLEVRR